MKPEDLSRYKDQKISLLEADGTEWCEAVLEFEIVAEKKGVWFVHVPQDEIHGDAAGLDWPLSAERIESIRSENGRLSVELSKWLVIHGERVCENGEMHVDFNADLTDQFINSADLTPLVLKPKKCSGWADPRCPVEEREGGELDGPSVESRSTGTPPKRAEIDGEFGRPISAPLI